MIHPTTPVYIRLPGFGLRVQSGYRCHHIELFIRPHIQSPAVPHDDFGHTYAYLAALFIPHFQSCISVIHPVRDLAATPLVTDVSVANRTVPLRAL